jgi:iron complex transport system ATP-binding protein
VSEAVVLDSVVACKALDLIVGDNRVLRGVDWHVRPGQRWVVLGPNGAGKSSLLRIAATYEMPSSGRVHVLGEQMGRVNVWTLRPRIGWASPGTARLLKPYLTVRQAIVTGQRAVMTTFRQQFDDHEWQRAEMLGSRSGLGELLDRRVDQLSEGERQRLLLARMLMPDPDLLLLDEPTAGLDLPGREGLIAQLTTLGGQARPLAIVMVTHHFEEIPPGFTHALLLRDGGVVAAGELASVLTEQNLAACFGVRLTLEHRDGRWWAWSATTDPGPTGAASG